MTWYFSWPLPATSTTSPARASSIALSIASRRSTIDSSRCPRSRLVSGRDAALNLLDDLPGILAARVVGGDDDEIAQPSGHRAHERPLGPIAVAAAAEHRDQPAAGQRPRRLEQVAQRVVGVGVVDDDRHPVLVARNDLKASGHALERLNSAFDRIERQIERHAGRGGGENVVDVRTADEPRTQAQRAARGSHVEGQALERERQRARGDVGGPVDARMSPAARRCRQAMAPRGSSTFSRLGLSRGSISNSRRLASK